MPFHQEWFMPDHIVKVTFTGRLTIEEITKSFVVSGKFLAESQGERIHFIHDWSGLESFPTNLSHIRQAIDIHENPFTDKLGWVVVFGVQQKLLRFVGDITFQLFKIRTHMTEDMESALEFLRKQDPTLKKFQHMSDVSWYLKGHILYCYDVVKVEDMITRNTNALKLVEQDGQPPAVHMLIDFSSTNNPNYDLDVRELVGRSTSSIEFAEARDNLIRHPLFGWVVTFNIHNRNINVGGKIVAMKYNYKRKEVNSLPEAITFLKQVDPYLDSQFSSQINDKL